MKYFFINHGYMGSNIENWFPWFKDKIDDDNNQCIIPQYPIEKSKHFYEYWKNVLDVYYDFGYINSNTVMIGHSSGSAFTMKYILNKKIKINKLILVSGFNNYYSDDDNDFHNVVNRTFYINDNDIVELKNILMKLYVYMVIMILLFHKIFSMIWQSKQMLKRLLLKMVVILIKMLDIINLKNYLN